MVLPPLGLFSLRRELPSCRAALSVFAASPFGLFRFLLQVSCRFGPLLPAYFAFPRIEGVHTLKHRVPGATRRAFGRFEFRQIHAGLIDDLLRNGSRGNLKRLVKLIGRDQDPGTADAEGITRSRLLDPALDSRSLQHLENLPCMLL